MREVDAYRKAEKCLRGYKINAARLDELRAELKELQTGSDIHAQDYSGRMLTVAGGADPVCAYVQKILNLEHRISVLERYTLPVHQLREDLLRSTDAASRHMLLILEQHYIAGVPMTRLLEVTGWNKSTFYSRRLSLVALAVSYFIEDKS